MNKKFVMCAIVLFMTMAFSSTALAFPNNTILCLNANISQVFNNSVITANNTCVFGCNSVTGSCNIYDPISSSLSGIALLIVAAIFSIIATKVSSGISFRGLQVEVLQPLFFTISIFMILIAFTIMTTGASGTSQIGLYNQLNAGYNTVMYVFIFFISFMVISFIVNIIMKAGKSA
jgi:hypothetical protein